MGDTVVLGWAAFLSAGDALERLRAGMALEWVWGVDPQPLLLYLPYLLSSYLFP